MEMVRILPYLIVIQSLKRLKEGKGLIKGQSQHPKSNVLPGQAYLSSLKLKFMEFVVGCENTVSSTRCPGVEKSLPQLETGIAIIDYVMDRPLGVESA